MDGQSPVPWSNPCLGGSGRWWSFGALGWTVAVSGPDKKGNRNVTLVEAGIDNAVPVHEAAFVRIQPVHEALKTTGWRSRISTRETTQSPTAIPGRSASRPRTLR